MSTVTKNQSIETELTRQIDFNFFSSIIMVCETQLFEKLDLYIFVNL